MMRQHVGLTELEAQIHLQNGCCLEAWRQRWLALDPDRIDCWPPKFTAPLIDAYPPLFRECLQRHYQEKRDLAKRWLFKNRWAKRQMLRRRAFGLHPLPVQLRTQQDRL
jgi:hypothetical protein